jgi:hypothetical protein
MQCSSCSTQNQQNARFCYKCGVSLSLGGNQTVSVHSAAPSQSNQSSTVKGYGTMQPQRKQLQTGIVGEAHHIQRISEAPPGLFTQSVGQQVQVLMFTVEEYDGSGNRLKTISVEMRGASIIGFINEGDQVQVQGRHVDGLVQATQVYNLSTEAFIRAKAPVNPLLRALMPLIIVCIIWVIIGLVFLLASFLHILR